MRTNLIRNLLRRKFVWYDDRQDRQDRSRWRRVIKREAAGDELIVLAQTNDGEYVVYSWLLTWDDPGYIPSDKWVGANRRSAVEFFNEQVAGAKMRRTSRV